MINLPIEFDVSTSNHYKDRKGEAKYRKLDLGVLRSHSRSL